MKYEKHPITGFIITEGDRLRIALRDAIGARSAIEREHGKVENEIADNPVPGPGQDCTLFVRLETDPRWKAADAEVRMAWKMLAEHCLTFIEPPVPITVRVPHEFGYVEGKLIISPEVTVLMQQEFDEALDGKWKPSSDPRYHPEKKTEPKGNTSVETETQR